MGHADTPPIQLDVRAAEQGYRFLSAGHDTANSTWSQLTLQNVNWRFCTVHMMALSTLLFFEPGCQVCGLQETRLTEAGQAWAREIMKENEWNSHWKRCSRLGKRDQEAQHR